jgi:hypothetical protein
VRERRINLGTAAMSRGSAWHTSITQNGSFKRSTAFLRFLVGQRQLLEHEDCVAGQDGLCERLQDLTAQAIKRYLGLPCRVQAIYMDSFHDGLYSGMWLYQEKRLDQLARASCAQTRRKKSLQARVVTYGRRHRFEICVWFFAGNEAIGDHAYWLSSRPSEDPRECVSRITSRLETAGIKTNALAGFVPEEMGFGIQTRRRLDLSMIATPI